MAERTISLPREHGAYLVLLGGVAAASALATSAATALWASLALAAAFCARGPLEALLFLRHPARADRLALALLVTLAGAGVALAAQAGGWRAAPAIAAAPLILVAAALARSARAQRSRWFELAGMGALGAASGLTAFAGGAPLAAAVGLALVLGSHAAASVLVVRAQLRPRERDSAAAPAALACLGLGAAALAVVGVPLLAVAFAPRLAQLAWSAAHRPAARFSPARVGARETLLLASTLALAVPLLITPSS